MKGKNAVKKNLCIVSFVLLFLCMPPVLLAAFSLEDLLTGYAERDIGLKELHIQFMQSLLEEKKVFTDNGINVTLSTGTMHFVPSGNGFTYSVAPEITFAFPYLNNTRIQAALPLRSSSVSAGTGKSALKLTSDASLSVKTDIISYKNKERKLFLEKAARQTELARRACAERALETEKNFWTELRSLYTAAAAAAKAQDSLIASENNFKTVKNQGYAAVSPKYRKAELAVKSDEYAFEEKKRLCAAALTEFALNCGKDADFFTEIPLLPDDLKSRPLLSFSDFDTALYGAAEQAFWKYTYNEKMRSSQKNFFLGAGFSYTYLSEGTPGKKDVPGTGTSGHIQPSNEIGAEVSASWKGVSAAAGVSITTENPASPRISFALGWDMNVFKNADYTAQIKQYDAESDLLAVQSAHEDKKKREKALETKAADLLWQRSKTAEEAALYEQLYRDMQIWFKEGIVSPADLLEAKINFEQMSYYANAAALDCIIYNIDVRRLFVQKAEHD
ncbi:hypothetical protein H0R92_04675 [Treponema sp. OMZ 840]|uniref:hypothetical protein n=1 Tax=Treponema sp. OMZ 840 TaxID=244313 RepID=UPI003D905DB0